MVVDKERRSVDKERGRVDEERGRVDKERKRVDKERRGGQLCCTQNYKVMLPSTHDSDIHLSGNANTYRLQTALISIRITCCSPSMMAFKYVIAE